MSANSKHGLRRSNADKRKAVLTLLNDEEWNQWSDREIARQCAVSSTMVDKYRKEMTANGLQSDKRKGADGRTIDTTNIGKRDIFGKKVKSGLDNPSYYEETEELPHGQFGMWLAMEFDWSYRTAYRFINVAENFKLDNLSNMKIAPSALYMLSSGNTPESAREEAMERAMKEPISYSDAKEITGLEDGGVCEVLL